MLTPAQARALGGSSGGGMSREAAMAKRNAMTSDREFGAKIMAGDKDALKELADISAQCIGTPDNFSRMPEGAGRWTDGQGHEVSADDSRALPAGRHI